MWYFTEFNGVRLPRWNWVADTSLTFADARMPTTGGMGEYDLYGSDNPLGTQTYRGEFMLPLCDYRTKETEIKGAFRRQGLLKRSDGTYTQYAVAKVTSSADVTTPADWKRGTKRMSVEFKAEPLWYDDTLTTVSFTSATRVFYHTRPNRGNARAIKNVVLTITSNISTFVTIGVSPYGDAAFYGEDVYGGGYYGGSVSDIEATTLTYTGNTSGPLVFDAGAGTVRLNGVDVYNNVTLPDTQMALLWIEPGGGELNFSQAVTGTLQFRSTWL